MCAGTECWDCALRLSDTVTVETECWAPILRLKCLRLVGAGVSILAVPSSPSPPPVVQPVRNEQAARLISQLQVLHQCTCTCTCTLHLHLVLQRYGGLSIQPVSEQTGLGDTIVRELEGARKILAEAIAEVWRRQTGIVLT